MDHPMNAQATQGHGHQENMSELIGGFVPLIAVFVYVAAGAVFHLMILAQ